MNLNEWVPALAATLRVPAPLVHMKAQQIARAEGIAWALEMPTKDVEVIRSATLTELGGTVTRTEKKIAGRRK